MNLKNADKCLLCRDEFKKPVVLPCKHVCCKECLEHYREDAENRTCPDRKCKELLPEDLNFDKKCRKALEEHSKFRKGLNQFFLKYLDKFVFKANQLPHDNIIGQLLQFVIHKKIKDEKKSSTKRLSPFEADDIDASPVIRSFVLQLILKSNFDEAQVHLEKFFNNAKFDDLSEIDLCLLMIYCFEDNLLTKEKGQIMMADAMKWIRDANLENLQDLSIPNLIQLAKLRLAFEAIAKYVCECLDGRKVADENLTKQIVDVLKRDETESLQKYIVRNVVRMTRQESIQLWKKDLALNMLLPEEIRNSAPDNIRDFYLFLETSKETSYKAIRDGLRNDAMKGKLELLPNLLRTHNYDRKKDVWDMAIWNLFSICKCPMKDGNILEAISQENANVAKLIESAQAQAMDEGTPMNEALMSLMWQFSVTMRHSNK